MKINTFLKNLFSNPLNRTTKDTVAQPTATRGREKVSATTTVAGRPPRRKINPGGWPGRNA